MNLPSQSFTLRNHPFRLLVELFSKDLIHPKHLSTQWILSIFLLTRSQSHLLKILTQTNFEFQHSFLLEEGENQINIKALDEAGNQTQKEYTVYKDTIPPVVTISFPTPKNPAMKKSFDVQGSTEPFTELYFNGELVFVDSSGQFTYPLRVDSVGVNTINAKAIDKSGNSTTTNLHIWAGVTIVLQIGNKTAFSNKQEQILNASPYINNGRTMVPFRYIGEALNATIGFEVNPLTKLVDQVTLRKE